MFKRLLFATSVLLTLWLSSLLACSCWIPSQAEAFAAADAIFRGKVVSIRHLNPITLADAATGRTTVVPAKVYDRQNVLFLVESAWKGNLSKQVEVLVTARPGMCDDYEFQLGLDYVVYASGPVRSEWELTVENLSSRVGLRRDPNPALTTVHVSDCPIRIARDVDRELKLLSGKRSFQKTPD